MGTGLKRVALDHGTIHAFIWAPPGQFVVDTPSARAVDLGCSYTLQVDASGAGLVRTALGWVGFQLNGRESFIPAAPPAPQNRTSARAPRTSKTPPPSSARPSQNLISGTPRRSNASKI